MVQVFPRMISLIFSNDFSAPYGLGFRVHRIAKLHIDRFALAVGVLDVEHERGHAPDPRAADAVLEGVEADAGGHAGADGRS